MGWRIGPSKVRAAHRRRNGRFDTPKAFERFVYGDEVFTRGRVIAVCGMWAKRLAPRMPSGQIENRLGVVQFGF